MFAAAVVGWLVALLGDRALKGITRGVLGPPEQRALAEALSLAFGVAFEDVPEPSRETFAEALHERFAGPPAVVLDGRTRVRTGLIRAIQAQIAPLADPGITPAGGSFFDAIGVDAAQVRDELADVIIRSIEQVGATAPALTPLINQLNADAILERVDAVLDQLGARPVLRGAAAGAAASRADVRRWRTAQEDRSAEVIDQLTEAFLAVPAVSVADSRQAVVEMLPGRLRNAIPHSRFPRIQVLEMIRASWNHEGGLRALVRAVRLVEGDSLAMDKLDSLILGLADPDGGSALPGQIGGPA